MISITIDGNKVEAEKDEFIINVARRNGIEIPTLCHQEYMEPEGVCRLCTVEIHQAERVRFVTACNYPVREEGLTVLTNSNRVKEIRRTIMDLLWSKSPDAKILQDLAAGMGIEKPPFKSTADSLCIMCGLCVDVCNDVVGAGVLGFEGRGASRRVVIPYNDEKLKEACIGCGACTYVCPTGVMQMEAEVVKNFWSLPAAERQCRYMRMGLFSQAICSNYYECWRCDIDQRMEDTLGTHPALAQKPGQRHKPIEVTGFIFKPDVYYHHGHVWVKPFNGFVRIGIDDFTAKLFGKINDIIPAEKGRQLCLDDVVWQLSCGKKDAQIATPLAGTVAEVNTDLINDPSLLWKDPYDRGWILDMIPQEPKGGLAVLMRDVVAKTWFVEECGKLTERVKKLKLPGREDVIENLAQNLSENDWVSLKREFFSV